MFRLAEIPHGNRSRNKGGLLLRAGLGGGLCLNLTWTLPYHTDEEVERRVGRVLFLMLLPPWGMDGNLLPQMEIKPKEIVVEWEGAGTGITFPGSVMQSQIPTGTRRMQTREADQAFTH